MFTKTEVLTMKDKKENKVGSVNWAEDIELRTQKIESIIGLINNGSSTGNNELDKFKSAIGNMLNGMVGKQ